MVRLMQNLGIMKRASRNSVQINVVTIGNRKGSRSGKRKSDKSKQSRVFELLWKSTDELNLQAKAADVARRDAASFFEDPMAHMDAFRFWLASLPAHWSLGSEYASAHLARKHVVLESHAIEPQSPFNPTHLKRMRWDQLTQISPDRSNFMAEVPSTLRNPGRLGSQLCCSPILVPMWSCLAKEAVALSATLQPGAAGLDELVNAAPQSWKDAAIAYQSKTGVNPCLAELVKFHFTTHRQPAINSSPSSLGVPKRRITKKRPQTGSTQPAGSVQ